jgi:NitT/TauT family transport system substrate-binding protein
MMLSKQWSAVLSAVLACSFAGHAFAADKQVVVSQGFQSMLYLPLYVAMDGGFFKKAGLEVVRTSRCMDPNGPQLQRRGAHPSM